MVLKAAVALLNERPLTRRELGNILAERWPNRDPISLAYAVTYLLPVVQVPPRGIWGARGPATWASAEWWLGRPKKTPPPLDELVMRYLAAFGPATVKDMQIWSGLTRLQEVVDLLAPKLRRFRSDQGDELVDLPDAPRPDPDTPAPVRFLPEYDNVLLSCADRGRVISGQRRVPLPPGSGGSMGTLLIDGFFQGTWSIARHDDDVKLIVEPFERLSSAQSEAVAEEGDRLLAFIAPEGAAGRDSRYELVLAVA